jgi:radical SAM protein with 4Fe4S-binding SPASM domain
VGVVEAVARVPVLVQVVPVLVQVAVGNNWVNFVVNRLITYFNRIKSPDSTGDLPSPGLYHFTRSEPGEKSRIHLRIEADQNSILLINANRIVHLNPTATLMAYLVLQQTDVNQVIKTVTRVYQVSKSDVNNDYAQFVRQFHELIRPDGACPIHDMNLEVIAPFSKCPSAPYRMDLALTYRCNNDCAHCYNARPRDYPELATDEWKYIINKLWGLGIPHIIFTGGEPTLRNDLPELIAYAERNGQITGINTNGRRLSDKSYVDELVAAGLDHVQITLESHDPAVHNQMVNSSSAWGQTVHGLRNVLESSLYVMTHTTMLRNNAPYIKETLYFLADEGVPTVGLNALIYSGRGLNVDSGLPEKELFPLLEYAREFTSSHHQRLIWYTPTEYCNFDPMQLELGIKGCTAALYNMCVEPDGVVIPCQSYYQPVGNLLNDAWKNIWNHPLCIGLRERSSIPQKCASCALISECGGGCPLRNQAHL